MTDLEMKILRYLADHPYTRQRYIASFCHLWLCNEEFLTSLHNVYKAGLVDCEYHHDPAQMEFYNLWYLTDAGKCAIINTEIRKGND